MAADGDDHDADAARGRLLARVFDGLPLAAFVKDRSFRYVFANPKLSQISGDPSLVLIGRTDFDAFEEAQARVFRKQDEAVYTSSAATAIDEDIFIDALGNKRVLATTKVPLREGDVVTHLIGVVQDITELKRVEESLRTVNEDLEARVRDRSRELEATQAALLRKERLAVVGELAGALAHQIRNPLGAISNATYVLARALADHPDPNVGRAVAIVHEEAWRANRIIGDLLEYARIRPAVRVRVRTKDIVARALFSMRIPDGVEIDAPEIETDPVLADEEQVVRALGNLLRNAVEGAAPAGTVALRVRVDGTVVELTIRDESPGGLPAVAIDDRLGPASEPPVPSSPKPLDVALGLATARALIENQGGTVELSPEGVRASFVVRLPLAPWRAADSIPDV